MCVCLYVCLSVWRWRTLLVLAGAGGRCWRWRALLAGAAGAGGRGWRWRALADAAGGGKGDLGFAAAFVGA